MKGSALLGAAAIVVAALSPASAKADDACWRALDAAITHRAAAIVPAYLQYTVKRSISQRGDVPLVTRQQVTYRGADGAARVVDSLYGDAVRYTYTLEPGPPFVGPSGDQRDGWIDSTGATIATVHAHAGKACDDLGSETVGGRATEHLRITPHRDGAPGIRDVWVGSGGEIWRAVVAQVLDGSALAGVRGGILVNCTIEVGDEEGHAVVETVRFHDGDLRLDGEWTFGDYAFFSAAPSGTFPP
ncbi:MAG: hypothetical protein M3R30_10695 [Candidatus Eremiobacteraeota bacterium]|nr:hypothetical protein [Candidatus Eremiobacteraeota bacterium]